MLGSQIHHYACLALILYIGVIDCEPHFRSDYKYFDSTKAYYKYHDSKVPWAKAKLTCESEGAILYYPEDGAEVNLVKTLYRDYIWIWLGVSRQEDSHFKSVDGRNIEDFYHNWDNGEPNNGNGFKDYGAENCVSLMHKDGKINDYFCNGLLSFVCKVTVRAVESGTITMEPEKQAEETRKPLVGRRNFYKYYANPKTWKVAKKTCEYDGAILEFPEDDIEMGSIVDYTNQTYWKEWMWVGASRSSVSQTDAFTTVDGRLLEDVYHNWGPIEPINENGNENCVVLCRDGIYRAHACDDRFPFMCKTTVFVSAIKPEKGLMNQNPEASKPTLGVAQNPYEIIQNLTQNHPLSNCLEGNADCKSTCGIVDKDSKIHTYFGTVVGEELRNFPVNKKLDAMYAIMKVIEEKWTETETECKAVIKPIVHQ